MKDLDPRLLQYWTVKDSRDELFFQLNLFLVGDKITFQDYSLFIKDKHKKGKLFYDEFDIPKKKGGYRKISSPNPFLKTIQRYILYKHLYNFRPHKRATGFIIGKSIVDNAASHVRKSHVYNIDLKDFFPSIGHNRVFELFKHKGYSDDCAAILTELCTLDGVLPQGAPTSPAISNMICYMLDVRLFKLARSCRLKYSRYADDITFSGKYVKNGFRETVKNIINEEGFRVSIEKERLMKQKKKHRQTVTGLVVNRKLSIGRTRYNQLRALLHRCKSVGALQVQLETRNARPNHFISRDISDINNDLFLILTGYLNLFKMIGDKNKYESILLKIMEIDWEEYYNQRASLLGITQAETSKLVTMCYNIINKKILDVIEYRKGQRTTIAELLSESEKKKEEIIERLNEDSDEITSEDRERYENRITYLEKENDRLSNSLTKKDDHIGKLIDSNVFLAAKLEKIDKMDGKLDSIDHGIIKIHKKLDSAINAINLIQKGYREELVRAIREAHADSIESICSGIADEISRRLRIAFDKNLDSEHISSFHDSLSGIECFDLLEEESKKDIILAEFLMRKTDDAAPSAIIQLCRVVEREIVRCIFFPFREFISSSEVRKPAGDWPVNESIRNSYNKLYIFCKGKKNDGRLTLGEFGMIISNVLENDELDLFSYFLRFINEKYPGSSERIVQSLVDINKKKIPSRKDDYHVSLREIRNYCAHPGEIWGKLSLELDAVQFDGVKKYIFNPPEMLLPQILASKATGPSMT